MPGVGHIIKTCSSVHVFPSQGKVHFFERAFSRSFIKKSHDLLLTEQHNNFIPQISALGFETNAKLIWA